METSLAIVLSGIFLVLSALHCYWGFGGRWGIAATLPETEKGESVLNPTTIHCFVVAAGLFGFGILALFKTGLFPVWIPGWLSTYGLWVVSAIFFLRAVGDFRYVGFFKSVRETKFGKMDTRFYSPLSFIIGLLALIIQLSADSA